MSIYTAENLNFIALHDIESDYLMPCYSLKDAKEAYYIRTENESFDWLDKLKTQRSCMSDCDRFEASRIELKEYNNLVCEGANQNNCVLDINASVVLDAFLSRCKEYQ